MYLSEEYEQAAVWLAEGFTGLDIKINGWCASYPRSLSLKGVIEVFPFLHECKSMLLNGVPLQTDPNILLAAYSLKMELEGDIDRSVEKYLSENTLKLINNATPWQKQAYQQCIQIIESLWVSTKKAWDEIDDLSYELYQSGSVNNPENSELPTAIKQISISRKGLSEDYIPESEYLDETGSSLSEYYDCTKEFNAGQLQFLVTLEDDEEVIIETDGAVLWKNDDELADIVSFFLKREGYQYNEHLMEVA